MRVLLVSQEFPPETAWGGIGTYAGAIAAALAAEGAEVHVLAVDHVTQRTTQERDGVTVHRAPLRLPAVAARVLRAPRTYRRVALAVTVRSEARRLGSFDVCEAPDWEAEGAGLNGPLVIRMHSGAAQVFPHAGSLGLDERAAMRIERWALRRAHVLTGTETQLAYAREALGIADARLRTVRYPVGPLTIGAPEAPGEVLFLGRLERRKGPETLVRALPALLERVPHASLTLAGADTGAAHASERQRLQALAVALGVRARVRFDPSWGAGAVRGHLERAAVVAAPSRWESFGYTVAEAMAAGRVVVASDIAAYRHLVSDGVTGRLVDPANPAAWSAALAETLEDPARAARMGTAASCAIAASNDPRDAALETLAAYEHAMASARG